MATRTTKLKMAQDEFETTPCKETAGLFLAVLLEYEADGAISDAERIGFLCDIRDWLKDDL